MTSCHLVSWMPNSPKRGLTQKQLLAKLRASMSENARAAMSDFCVRCSTFRACSGCLMFRVRQPSGARRTAEVLALNHESRILGQWSNPVSGSRRSQASSPWAKQHRPQPVPSWRNHIQGWMKVRESYSRAFEQGSLARKSMHVVCREGKDQDRC